MPARSRFWSLTSPHQVRLGRTHDDADDLSPLASSYSITRERSEAPSVQPRASSPPVTHRSSLTPRHTRGSTATRRRQGRRQRAAAAAAAALWALATDNVANQIAISTEGIEPLVRLIGERGLPEVHRDAAGALWSLAASESNAHAITSAGASCRSSVYSHTAPQQHDGRRHRCLTLGANRVAIARAGAARPGRAV